MPRKKYVETRYKHPTAFEGQERLFLGLRKQWVKFKNSKLFNKFKHSRLNPYHWGVEKIVADTPEQEIKIAREKGIGEYIDKKGVRCWVGFDGRPQEEYEKTGKVVRKNGDVTDRIPRDKDGKLDLMAEEPIIISIVPIEGISLTGHACMQYKDRVVNRVLTMDTDPIYPRYQDLSDYYFIYPSQVGIDSKKLIREIDKHNILHGDEPYNIFTNNCAKNVAEILKKLGVKDINFIGPDKVVSYPTPGNNPFHFGVEDWCMRHGVPATQEEIATLCQYHEIPDLDKRNKWQEDVRNRYKQYKDYIINEQTQSKLSKLRKKVAKGTMLEKKKLPARLKYVEKGASDLFFGRDE